MNTKILLVGSQGYLGSRLTDYLQEYGYECVGADAGFFQYGVLYFPKQIPIINKEARTLTEKDIKGFNIVLLLAGISNDPFGDLNSEDIYDPTREYAIRIAKMCKKLGIRYLFPSSCSVYGIGEGLLNEDSPYNPQTPYSLNKVQIEEDLTELADPSFSPIALRLSTVFGASPRMRFDVVINMLCGMAVTQKKVILNSDGQAWRPHLHIEDVCEAVRCCIEWDYNDGRLMVLNVGHNNNNWKILDVAKLIKSKVKGCELEFLGHTDKEREDDLVKDRKIMDGVDKRTYQVSFDRIHKILPEYKTSWDVESGVGQLIEDLEHWKLNEAKFKQRDFYRLQQIEYLYQTRQVDENLFFCG